MSNLDNKFNFKVLRAKRAGSYFRRIIILLVAIITILGFDAWIFLPSKNQEKSDSSVKTEIEKTENLPKVLNPSNGEVPKVLRSPDEVPEEAYLEVPWAPQAPKAVWDDLHNEACEEASLVMAKYWLENKRITADEMEEEILKAVAWQEENWGGHYDLPVEKIVELAKEYFKIEKVKVIYNIESVEQIKEKIAAGNLVLVPAAGRLLDNPYYRQPVPVYHMLVLKGFDKKGIITNDPGTKRGEDFRFKEDNLWQAIHDWPAGIGRPLKFGQEISKDEAAIEILEGQKVMIVVEK